MKYLIADHPIELPAWVAATGFGRALAPFALPAAPCSAGENPRAGAAEHAAASAPFEAGAEAARCCATRDSEPDCLPGATSRQTPRGSEPPVLILLGETPVPAAGRDYRTLDTFDFPDAKALCRFGRDERGYRFSMLRDNGKVVTFTREFGTAEVLSDITPADPVALLRFGLWMMFGLAINPRGSVAVHASVIRTGAGAVLFLGESGTGKSTHTRLWREHIPGATLLNDDSPILRIRDGIPTVYGSPWSGKTPCYRAECSPVRGVVRLSQAPHNRIRRLPALAALGALLPSCPPAFAFDGALQDRICATLSVLLARVPVYQLECLPDAAAAELSYTTLFPEKP